jgi:competence protein ComEC
MSRSRVFFFFVASFIAGVFVRSFFGIPATACFFATIASLIAIAIFHTDKKILIFSGAIIFALLGSWMTDRTIAERTEGKLVGRIIQSRARVISQPQEKGTFQNIILEFPKENMHALARVPLTTQYSIDDEVDAECFLEKAKNISEDFDYVMYLAKDHVEYVCEKPRVLLAQKSSQHSVYASLTEMRMFFEEKINAVIPQPEGALATGLIFGGSAGLSEETKNNFSRTGLTHIIAVSGYNVTIVAQCLILLGVGLGLWRKHALWFALAGIVFFVIMTGMPASAVRAGVMGSIVLWALANGRLARSQNAILLAGAIMLAYNPMLLRWDIGFQLSFLATIGIVTASSLWQQCALSKHFVLGKLEIVVLTLSAQIFVMPIIAYNFQTVSVISLAANMLVLPIIPFSMLLVLFVALGSLTFPIVHSVFAWVAYVPLKYEVFIIGKMSSIPWASVEVSRISPWWIAAYYVILWYVVYVLRRKQQLILQKNE